MRRMWFGLEIDVQVGLPPLFELFQFFFKFSFVIIHEDRSYIIIVDSLNTNPAP